MYGLCENLDHAVLILQERTIKVQKTLSHTIAAAIKGKTYSAIVNVNHVGKGREHLMRYCYWLSWMILQVLRLIRETDNWTASI